MIKFSPKIFFLTIMLGLVLDMLVGVSYAQFTAHTQVTGNVFTTGTWTANLTTSVRTLAAGNLSVPAATSAPTPTPNVVSESNAATVSAGLLPDTTGESTGSGNQ